MRESAFDLRQLEAFAAVVETGTVTGAARLLGRSPSVVTRQIQELEIVLNYALLHRSGPKVSPTEQGYLFFEEIDQLLQSFQHAEACARAIGSAKPRPLEIAAIPALSVSLVPRALAAIDMALLPEHVHVNTVSAERTVQEVVSRTADYGVSSYPFDRSDLDVHWIGEAPCVAVMRKDHPMASNTSIRLRDLQGERLLTLSVRLRTRIDYAFTKEGVTITRVFQSGSSSTVLGMAREGLGVAVIDPATAFGLPLVGLVIKPLEVSIPFLFGAFTRSAKTSSATIKALNASLMEQAPILIPGFRLHPELR